MKLLHVVMLLAAALPARADMANARKWLKQEFTQSTLTPQQQLDEMQWFVNAAQPYRGMTIRVASEFIPTHVYERDVLAKAFFDITGIKVEHDIIPEGQLVDTLFKQMRSGRSFYDAYVNDTDSIGAHSRFNQTVPLSDFMRGEGRDVTLPTLDVHDFIGRSFGIGLDGKLYQLPAQQFANLYWFRYDWFNRPELKRRFRDKYGYELGVPINWQAYEDIADFFSNDVKHIDGVRVYGHLDYAKFHPSLGWRFSDSWLSLAGTGDKGIPFGRPVDDWGIRVEGCTPVGASVQRGGELNGPSSVYALQKYIDWLTEYAPPEAMNYTFDDIGSALQKGNIAQMVFLYTVNTPALTKPGSPLVNADGTPRWRYAPSPHGSYWEEGMKLGYQDAGAWTLLKSTPLQRRKAAWLYAQFTVARSVSLKKTLVGLTPIRESDLNSPAMSAIAPKLGGLVEFYRSPARVAWTPTGTNVPDYPGMAPLWWQNVGLAISGRLSAQQAMDRLAQQMDQTLQKLSADKQLARCRPQLNPPGDAHGWMARSGAPKPARPTSAERGETIGYDALLRAWREGRVR